MKYGGTTEKFVLNCGSGESTLRCLSIAFGCRVKKLRRVLRSIDIEALFGNIDIPPEKYLYNYVVENLGDPKQISSKHWFHVTRTKEGNVFSQGLLPLDDVLDVIWDMLESFFEGTAVCSNLQMLRREGVDDRHFILKTTEEGHSGPYGILVREVAFHLERLRQHNYLEFLEIIEDICNGYSRRFGSQIYDEVSELLRPCIVEIKSNQESGTSGFMAALYYAYTYSTWKPVSGGSLSDINRKGCRVAAEEILSVSYV